MPNVPHPVRRAVAPSPVQEVPASAAPTPKVQYVLPAGNGVVAAQPQVARGGRLEGRIALISGGGGGIGRTIAQLFVSEGASVVVADLEMSSVKEVADALGAAAEPVVLDVRDPEAWATAVDAARDRFGAPPDVLVQSAGVNINGGVEEATVEDMHFAFDINVVGVLHGIQAVAPGMKASGRGSIVAVTSMGGVSYGVPGNAAYCASKAAATALVQCAALDLGPSRIRVNAIVPGQVDTPMSRASATSAPHSFFEKMPVPRMGQPRDIAQSALFLASEESSWITGTKFLVDGGMDAGPGLG
ncbi:SDR family NAD(P)-dependent oxidoreductase [Pseudonocardia halophobica]|uniref:SDR family NAD(P)-dependent oxidoreductase n=1 Tax=Pseudonocardia halophobica TaxID=29401 RepID=UPI003D8C977E